MPVRITRSLKLPPGPPRHCLTGNLRDIPLNSRPWETYNQWKKRFGDLVYLNIFGRSLLFVNSRRLASELFDVRGAIYSNRFRSTMACDLGGFDWSVIFMPPNETWKHHRSILQQQLGKLSMVQHQITLEKHSRNLLALLFHRPLGFLEHSRHAIGAMILESTYGLSIQAENDPHVEVAERAVQLFMDMLLPGRHLVDILPFLKYIPSWFPGTAFKQKANEMKIHIAAMRNEPFAAVKAALKAGNVSPSFVSTILEAQSASNDSFGKGKIDEELIKSVGATIYFAGIDTTELTIQFFFIAMILYPDIQKAAQEELKKVIGTNSFPTFKDRPNLPYINALCKEVLRWYPVTPLGFPHVLKQDDVVDGYFVPKGTLVMGNTLSFLRSEDIYGPDGDIFNPERFLKEGVKDPDPAFGYGRRVCPGRYLADNILFIIVASVLYAFDIKPDEKNLPNLDEFMPGFVPRAKPFGCKITPRTSAMIPVLEHLTNR
ncbi:hypothetical protein Clacol_000031 [Clathrus columnatus]|uniref:Cytochrome P450 n=1 Tax=Clathrus columnatus TaxID=1419009 RepID=A0AAV4ZZM5_9AGAM|nr:hypothetical protein Clacol_000031 [Clathrus columnatus]